MIKQKIKIHNPSGLHLRPAGVLCEKALEFKSHITFIYRDGNVANAKSVLSILGASIRHGDEIEFVCEGIDEEQAMAALLQEVERGLGEG